MATTSTRPKIRIGRRSAGLTPSAAEFDRLPARGFDRNHCDEAIRGILVASPPAGDGIGGPNEELGDNRRVHKGNHPAGGRVDASLPEQALPIDEDRRRCDRAIWVGLGRVPDPEGDFPAIVVEFASRSRRDFLRDSEEKRDESRRGGAQEYWIVDRFRRIMMVHRFARDGRPESSAVVAEAASSRTALIPGFAPPPGRPRRAADDWSRPARPRKNAQARPPEGDPR